MPLAFLLFDDAYEKTRLRAAIGMYLAILVLGSVPGARMEIGTLAPGVVLHFVAYSFMAFLLFSGISGSMRTRAAAATLLIAAMGALDELVQSFFTYRSADVNDWYVDIAAGFVTCAALWLWFPRLRRASERGCR